MNTNTQSSKELGLKYSDSNPNSSFCTKSKMEENGKGKKVTSFSVFWEETRGEAGSRSRLLLILRKSCEDQI